MIWSIGVQHMPTDLLLLPSPARTVLHACIGPVDQAVTEEHCPPQARSTASCAWQVAVHMVV
jgi:hypothetical protein